ncbi:DNA replication complex GINS family protein [Marine Group I thaumarchaeote]|jgi:DNA replication initiation complex subunit (GINS family)|uniref:DNA replication complex GINS family protein n=1 Tax=Marine Group I thaumarchaeote TaxID=2511932 RepID=A0A7K4NDY7_9ARCH|nr:DNA replication complex GINS family protein [Marine Group I thaumarchaeote]
MSEQNKININYLQTLVLQESESDTMQEIDSNLYNSISELIKNLKSEEYDGIKAKINQAMISMITDTTSALLKLRLEKAILENSNQSVLLNEEKYILDSKKEMLERRETILSGILNGKPHSLDDQ